MVDGLFGKFFSGCYAYDVKAKGALFSCVAVCDKKGCNNAVGGW